jgi:hypothetical protein
MGSGLGRQGGIKAGVARKPGWSESPRQPGKADGSSMFAQHEVSLSAERGWSREANGTFFVGRVNAFYV